VSALLGAVATAAALGVTHAIEPDHVAGVASLTGRYGDRRLSALVGACFAAGHVALVVAWLAIGYALFGRTNFGDIYDVIGTLGVALLLGALGATMLVGGLRSVVHAHEHTHDGDTHRHRHVHLPVVGALGREHGTVDHEGASSHDHDHTLRSYLLTGLFGALFTLSPPLSMLAFVATVLPAHGPEVVALAVVAYTVGIAGTMSALGAGVGTFFGAVADRPRAYAAARSVAGLLVLAVAASLLV
jgi:high-affinity nickel permease